jgi:molybdate transport system ATP-binding protein
MSVSFSARLRLGAFDYDASFSAEDEILVLFGHSGAGKSITLQLIAGLLRPSAGHIEVSGATVFDSEAGMNVRPQDRAVGYVVQELALFPHMSVADNVAFGLPRGVDRGARVFELLKLLRIDELAGRRPATLSGGQRQRVALARALGRASKVLLLDEPFSALDDALRATLRRELLRLRNELGLTILFVTHDLREAHLLADRIAVFDAGSILQLAARDEVFRRPRNRRVAELTGTSNILPATVIQVESGTATLEIGGRRFSAPAPAWPVAPGAPITVALRADRVNLRRPHELANAFEAEVAEEFAFGSSHVLRMRAIDQGPEVEVEIASRPYEVLDVANVRRWLIELPAADLHIMPE